MLVSIWQQSSNIISRFVEFVHSHYSSWVEVVDVEIDLLYLHVSRTSL